MTSVEYRGDKAEAVVADLLGRTQPSAIVAFLAGPMHQHLQHRADARFKGQGTDSGPWAELTEATHSWRRHQLGAARAERPINERTGDLRQLLTGEAPELGFDPIGAFLRFPGNSAQARNRRQIKMAQAAGKIPRRSGKRGTARPVVEVGGIDVLFAHKGIEKFLTMGLGGGVRN